MTIFRKLKFSTEDIIAEVTWLWLHFNPTLSITQDNQFLTIQTPQLVLPSEGHPRRNFVSMYVYTCMYF